MKKYLKNLLKIKPFGKCYSSYKRKRAERKENLRVLVEVNERLNAICWQLGRSNPKNSYASQNSFDQLDKVAFEKHENNIAIVSILPPESSGIANYTLYSFAEAKGGFDLFSVPVADGDYFINKHFLNRVKCNLYHLDCLPFADSIKNYRKIVIIIGNSNHHFYIWSLLRELKRYGVLDKVVLYVHDIFLHNICFDGRALKLDEYITEMSELYELPSKLIQDLRNSSDKWALQSKLSLDYHITGLRIFQNYGVKSFLVNSMAAKKWILEDLDLKKAYEVNTIFLPIINQYNAKKKIQKSLLAKNDNCIYLGSFGVVSDAKRVADVIESVRIFNESSDKKMCLILAGWCALEYFKHKEVPEFVMVFDSPSDEDLQQLMTEVDYAIQLRRTNLGESSGVVPQLIANNKPIIVTAVGAFVEFGDCVKFVAADAGVNEIVEKLKEVVNDSSYESLQERMHNYVLDHSPKKFSEALKELYG